MKALALDFDGVISDSAAESFVVALSTYVALRPTSDLTAVAAALADLDPARIRRHPLYRDFVHLMPLGNRAEDFAVVLGVLEAGGRIEDQAAYDARRAAESGAFLERFHADFYERRGELRRRQPAAWAGLLSPYPQVVAWLRRRASDTILCIATAKDGATVTWLLGHYGIGALFPPARVIDKEHGRTKRAHLRALGGRLGLEPRAITFVDDKFNHLADVASLGVRCALAGWGYNGPREHRLAREAGYPVLTPETLDRLLSPSAAVRPSAGAR